MQARQIVPNDGTATRTIKKAWLFASSTQRRLACRQGWLKDAQGDPFYQKTLKQALMIAAEELRLRDAKELSAYAMGSPEIEEIQDRVKILQSGTARFTMAGRARAKPQRLSERV